MELFNIHRPSGRPLITAHAGCQNTVPNSRESIVAAYHSAADIIEVDIRASADGVVFLMHDEAPSAAEGNQMSCECTPFEHMSWKEIQTMEGGRSEAFCLEDFWNLVENFEAKADTESSAQAPRRKPFFNLDIKDPGALSSTAKIVHSHGMRTRVIFSGLEEKGIEQAYLCIPEYSYFFNADNILTDHFQPRVGAIDKICSLALKYGCKGINLEWVLASSELVRAIHEKGLLVMLWTVDDESAMRQAMHCGPDSITTHFPNRLAELMGKTELQD